MMDIIFQRSDLLLTALIPLSMMWLLLAGSGRMPRGESMVMSRPYTTVLKGLCAIIVILVHFPEAKANTLQDAMGSFAYVAVTFFFLFSSYGMMVGETSRPDYFCHFWRNRLSSLLVPNLVINFIFVAVAYPSGIHLDGGLWTLVSINGYVWVLLQYCLVFYVVSWLGHRYGWSLSAIMTTLCIIVALSSLVTYIVSSYSDIDSAWCYERVGLIWGLVIFAGFDRIKARLLGGRPLLLIAVLLPLALIFGVLYLKYKTVWFTGEYILKIVLGLVIVMLVLACTARMRLGNKASLFLGSISYEIYLSHAFVMQVLDRFFPSLSSGLFILITVIVTIAFSAAIHSFDSCIVGRLRHG